MEKELEITQALSQGMRAEYWHQDHTAKNGVKGPRPSLTRLAFSDYVVQDGVIETQDDPNTPQNDVEITQELHYYPFGMEQLGSWYGTVAPDNDYRYNGKELNEDYGIDLYEYGFRWYDAAIGRFIGVDPIADEFAHLSVYNYASNDPVKNIDLHGLQGVNRNTGNQTKINFELKIGVGATFGAEANVGGVKIGALADFGTSQVKISRDGVAREKTKGFEAGLGPVGYGREVVEDHSNVTTNSDGVPVQQYEGTKTVTDKVTWFFNEVQFSETESFTATVSTEVPNSNNPNPTVRSGIDFVNSTTASTIETHPETATNSTQANTLEFGFKINAGFRLEGAIRLETPLPSSVRQTNSRWEYTCFVEGTKVLMSDGMEKNIEDIREGDIILSVDTSLMEVVPDTVLQLPKIVKGYKKIHLETLDGTILEFSPAHPIWVEGKGWSVFDLNEAKHELDFEVSKLERGDVLLMYTESNELIPSIISRIYDTGEVVKMYNIENVKNNHTFFANKILVHNKRL